MDCRPEHVGAATWHLCPDLLQAPGARLRALVQARLVDEITLRPVVADVVETPDLRLALHVASRIGRDGVAGLAGRPASLFPGLALAGAAMPMHVAARGYLPLDLDGMLGPFAGFPEDFTALEHFGQRVAYLLADAKLALGWAGIRKTGHGPANPYVAGGGMGPHVLLHENGRRPNGHRPND